MCKRFHLLNTETAMEALPEHKGKCGLITNFYHAHLSNIVVARLENEDKILL